MASTAASPACQREAGPSERSGRGCLANCVPHFENVAFRVKAAKAAAALGSERIDYPYRAYNRS